MNTTMKMELSKETVIKIIKDKKKFSKIQDTRQYESRIRVLSYPLMLHELNRESGWQEFKTSISNRLNKDKFNKVMLMFDYPLSVTSIVSDIMGTLNRVWNSRNANFFLEFPNSRSEENTRDLLLNLNTRVFVEKTGRYAFNGDPQIIIVVDKNKNGEPYYISLDSSRVIDYSYKNVNDKEHFDWVIFEHSLEEYSKSRKICFYDSYYYRVLTFGDNNELLTYEQEAHNLGYCPARWFIDKPLTNSTDEKRYSPLGNVLGLLCRWQQFDVYSHYAELYGTFPIIEYADEECENEFCTNGMISKPTDDGGWTTPKACTSCNTNKFIGPGTDIKINPRMQADDVDSKGYFRFISPPTSNLEYEDNKQLSRENMIKLKTTGANRVIEKSAINESQVSSLMENRKNPLLILSGIASRAHKWLEETALKLWLDTEVNSYANYGTEWFLINEVQLQNIYSNAKKNGLPESELDQIYKLLIETKYKSQPRLVKKLLIENQLNPAPYNTLEECYEKVSNGVMQEIDLYIKANITKLISKFERINGSVIDFGENISFDQKINAIYNSLTKYVEDEKSKVASMD